MASNGKTSEGDQTVIKGSVTGKTSPFQMALRAMEMDATAEVEAGAFSGDDLNALLSAESEAELWEADEQGPLNAQHLAGCEIGLIDVTVKFSRGGNAEIKTPFVTDDGKKMYLMVTAVRLSDAGEKSHLRLPAVGEVFQFNTSARYLTTKIWAFYSRGYIGNGKTLEAVIRETDLGDGTGVLKLRPMPRRVVRTETV